MEDLLLMGLIFVLFAVSFWYTNVRKRSSR